VTVAFLPRVCARSKPTIKADIVQNLADGNLSIDTIARRRGITPRYVSMLFDGDATTSSEFVLMKRLDQAHRMLISPRYSNHTVSSVAFEAGFHLYYPSRRQSSAAFSLLVEALRHRG
jgi:AraC-like DNA-binding protein